MLSVMLTDYSQQLHDTFGVNMSKYTPAQVPLNIGSKVFPGYLSLATVV